MFYEMVDANSQMAATAADVRKRIVEGDFYARDVVDAAFQKWEGDEEITLIDVLEASQIAPLQIFSGERR